MQLQVSESTSEYLSCVDLSPIKGVEQTKILGFMFYAFDQKDNFNGTSKQKEMPSFLRQFLCAKNSHNLIL